VFEELAWFGGFSTWFIGSDLEHSYRVIDKPAQYTIANWYEANPTTDTTAPANVTGTSKVSTDTTATLSWVNPTATDFSHVNIYRDNEYIGATASGSFADAGLVVNETYQYLLTSEDVAGNESAGV